MLDPGREQHLHAHADAEDGAAELDPAGDELVPADRAEAGHAGGERAHAGDDEAVAVEGGVRVGGHPHVGADPGDRPLGRAEVP